jgi:hypothetical protein
MCLTKVVEKMKTHSMFSSFLQKSCSYLDNVAKCFRAAQVTDYNMVHAHFLLNTKGYRNTLNVCNTYCFSIDNSIFVSIATLAASLLHLHIRIRTSLALFH